ncbi:MAG: hypothetical protein C5B53_07730 [Candidatus Melainabacteria bacterium]|nr:MAG: hypothetical protein C5B53_07730 [Candidatus Melainabacteria bacterium]
MNTTLSSKTSERVGAEKHTALEKIRGNADLLCVSIIVIIFLVRFSDTIFLHKPISKLYLTALWDSLFYTMRAGQSFNMDPSLVQQHIPERFLVANLWHHTIPLWNPFTGFGVPLLADPNAFALSPIFAPFTFFPSMYTWNIVIILQLLVGALFTYFLGRELALNRPGSMVASFLFAFCPAIQSQCEQVYGSCLIPFVFFFFVRVGKKKSLRTAMLAGIAAAVDLLSANPESAFITMTFAVVLSYLTVYLSDRRNFRPVPIFGRFFLAGLIAFGLTAPVLLPFAEYLLRCDSYKFADKLLIFPLQGIFSNFLFPFYQRNNLFWGPLSWWGILAALLLPNKNNANRLPLFICLVFSLFAIAQIFPLNCLFSIPPFSMVLLHYYVLPQYIFFVSILSGLGIGLMFDAFAVENTVRKVRILILGLIPVVLSLALSPFVCTAWHDLHLTIPYALTVEDPQFDWSRWAVNGICALAMLLTLLVVSGKSPKIRIVGLSAFLTIGILDLLVVSYSALPTRPAFRYPHNLPIDTSKIEGRFLTVGNHLLKPNINLVYQLPMVLEWNALHPKGFPEFLRGCGASVDKFGQCFPPTINRLLDITGTRTIISQQPLLDEEAIRNAVGHKVWRDQVNYNNLLTISDLELFQDPKANTLFCRLTAEPLVPGYPDFHLHFDIKDKGGSSLLYTEPQPISSLTANQSITCSSFLPSNARNWTISLRLLSDKDSLVIAPKKVPFGMISPDGSWLLATSDDLTRFTKINNDRFKLLLNRDGIFTYENRTALDRYFFVRQVKWMNKRDNIVDYLKTNANCLSATAVLEDNQKERFEKLLATLEQNLPRASGFDKSGKIVKLNPTSKGFDFTGSSALTLSTDTSKPALLIVSELDFPGWKAFMNGADWPIFRADHQFRAVLIPPGNNLIEFKYEPLSFRLGVALFMITSAAMIALLVNSYLLQLQEVQGKVKSQHVDV